jgi:hypothetical protein
MIKKLSPFTWYVILLVIGVTLALTLPPDAIELKVLHISPIIYRAAILTLILPYAVIWFAAFYAFDLLSKYAHKLHANTHDGEAFKHIATGVGVMAWGLAIPTILALILGAVATSHPEFNSSRTIINNYITVLVLLVAFTLVNKGTRKLADLVKARPTRLGTQVFVLAYVTISVFFVYFVIHNHDAGANPYHLAIFPLIVTLIIPNLWTWCIGLLSAYELWIYARKAVGVLYKRALAQLSGGIALVIAAAITGQYLTNVYASRTSISLSSSLVVVYCLLVLQASGYALIALGAKRLKRIEEV